MDDGILGSTLGQLGQVGKQVAKQVVKMPADMVKDAGEQVGGVKQSEEKPAVSAASNAASGEPQGNKGWPSDNERIKFLRDLYGKTDMSKDGEDKKPTEFEKQIAGESPEKQKQLLELRQKLHKEEYYDPTFNPVKKQEERPAEKVENEKKMEMQELEEKDAKKPPPLAVVREQNKAEMFRGASG